MPKRKGLSSTGREVRRLFCSGCFFQQLVANKDSLEAQISVSNVTDSQVCPPLASCSHSASSFEVPSTMESEVHRIPAKRDRPVGSVSKGRCTPRLCGRERVIAVRDGLCHDIYDPGECSGGRRLYYTDCCQFRY